MTAQKKDMALGLDLVSEVVLTPTFPEAEVSRKVLGDPGGHQALRGGSGHRGGPRPRPPRLRRPPVRPCRWKERRNRWHGSRATTSSSSTASTRAPTRPSSRSWARSPWTRRGARSLARFGSWPRPERSGPRRSPWRRRVGRAARRDRQARAHADDDHVRPSGDPTDGSRLLPAGRRVLRARRRLGLAPLRARADEESGLAYAVYSYVAPWRYGGVLRRVAPRPGRPRLRRWWP